MTVFRPVLSFLSRVSVPVHAERDIVLPILSVRPMPVLCLNEWTYRHMFMTFW